MGLVVRVQSLENTAGVREAERSEVERRERCRSPLGEKAAAGGREREGSRLGFDWFR